MSAQLMVIVAEGQRQRVYVAPSYEHEVIASSAQPEWKPEADLPHNPRDFKTPNYGMTTFANLFTARQLVALTTFSDLVSEASEQLKSDGVATGIPDDSLLLSEESTGAMPYADAVATYLGMNVSRLVNRKFMTRVRQPILVARPSLLHLRNCNASMVRSI